MPETPQTTETPKAPIVPNFDKIKSAVFWAAVGAVATAFLMRRKRGPAA